uniref:Uncharacterized protein n=1 Tax=Rhipicephalus appendiculatus TaxID=34631 RepID=A0A131YAK5_RHIAP
MWIRLVFLVAFAYGASIFTYNPRCPEKEERKCREEGSKFACLIQSAHVTVRTCLRPERECSDFFQKYCRGLHQFLSCKTYSNVACTCLCCTWKVENVSVESSPIGCNSPKVIEEGVKS